MMSIINKATQWQIYLFYPGEDEHRLGFRLPAPIDSPNGQFEYDGFRFEALSDERDPQNREQRLVVKRLR